MTAYTSVFLPVAELEAKTRARMLDIFLRHYDGTSPTIFQADLQEKDEALLLYADGALAGFSTVCYYPFIWQGRRVNIVFSGDTIVSREHWGQQKLAAAWLAHMGARMRREPDTPLFWFLIVKGHRTFRYLDIFALSWYPRENDAAMKKLAAALARQRFGEYFDAGRGLLVFPYCRGRLAADIAEPSPAEYKKQAVRFFLERNPGYRRGDELVCLCSLRPDNLRPMARRLFTAGEE